MEKVALKSLTKQIFDNLITQIDMETNVTKEQIIHYLKEAILIVSDINDDNLNSVEQAKELFTNSYKEITQHGLASYEATNNKFKELSEQHEQAISECFHPEIDLTSITDKFNQIQIHMAHEVKKANATIASLKKQVQILEDTSNLDSLTKIYNRRALNSYLGALCEKNTLSHEVHILILDLDDFKSINDTYGHIAGDKILIFIANVLKRALRDVDKIFRYGGEEFVIIFNNIDTLYCKKVTSRLLKIVSENKLIYKGETIHVTISIGTTKLVPNDTPESVLTRADKALYFAKKNGKNQMQSEVINGI